jgi:SAM-dependent methyltransferase
MAQSRSEIAGLLERHGLAPIHRLGQHFLADANITRRIVDLAGVTPGSKVVEIGAGTGTLTKALAEKGCHVVAYEIDEGLRPILVEVTNGLDVDLRFADVMDVDFYTDLEGSGWAMVANLPYNVGTPVVLEAMRAAPNIEQFVVMVQREVARRWSPASTRTLVSDSTYRPRCSTPRPVWNRPSSSWIDGPRWITPTAPWNWPKRVLASVARCCAAHWLPCSTSRLACSRRRASTRPVEPRISPLRST